MLSHVSSSSLLLSPSFLFPKLLLAYSDEATAAAKSVSGMEQMIGIAGVGTVGLFGVLASALKLPEAGKVCGFGCCREIYSGRLFLENYLWCCRRRCGRLFALPRYFSLVLLC